MASQPLITVQNYVDEVRTLLLDKIRPYRYTDEELVTAFNTTILEARRVRPDLFVTRWGSDVPYFSEVSGVAVPIEPQFRLGFVYGIIAHALMRDDEDVQDARVNSFYGKFYDILVGVRPRAFTAGAPAGGGSDDGQGRNNRGGNNQGVM